MNSNPTIGFGFMSFITRIRMFFFFNEIDLEIFYHGSDIGLFMNCS